MLVLVPGEIVGTVDVSPVPICWEGGGIEVSPFVFDNWDAQLFILFDSSA